MAKLRFFILSVTKEPVAFLYTVVSARGRFFRPGQIFQTEKKNKFSPSVISIAPTQQDPAIYGLIESLMEKKIKKIYT